MYPKILNFRPAIMSSFVMTLARQCICPLVGVFPSIFRSIFCSVHHWLCGRVSDPFLQEHKSDLGHSCFVPRLTKLFIPLDWLTSSGCLLSRPRLLRTKVYSAFHPSGVGKWVPAAAGKAKAGIAHSACRWNAAMQAVQVRLWIPW